jgi:mRNA interferase YafQ
VPTPVKSGQFKRDAALMQRRRKDMAKLRELIDSITAEQPLPAYCRPHLLHGKKWEGKWECHIELDWLFVYEISPAAREVLFHRTGTHADLCKS